MNKDITFEIEKRKRNPSSCARDIALGSLKSKSSESCRLTGNSISERLSVIATSSSLLAASNLFSL